MQLANLAKSSKLLGRTLRRNSPTILTGLAVGGLITTVFMAVRATPKAMELIEDLKEKTIEELHSSPTKLEYLQVLWKPYLPAALMGVSTIVCMVGSNHINLRRNAALVGLYSLAESTLREYQSKVVETIGKNKEEILRGEIAQDTLNRTPISERTVILTGKGDYLFYDVLSGRYFRSDIEKLRKIQNDLNHKLLSDMYISLNEMYYEMGLEEVELGGQQGWEINHLLEFKFSSKISTDGEPCVVIGYAELPKGF